MLRRSNTRIVLLFFLLTSLMKGDVTAQGQYVVINIAPEEGEHQPIFEQIRHIKRGNGTDHVGLGIGAIFSYLGKSRQQCTEELTGFLSLAERYDIPVVVQLDGEQYWNLRPELWNWWDPARPGYDTANRQNVEWYGWGPEYALKIAWRNWGTQARVLPPPNLMSMQYRNACHDEMRYYIPIVLEWWKQLPPDKKFLLLGIKIGWESSIGVNAFYYPDGNALLKLPEKDDPRRDLEVDSIPGRGVTAIGYAAVTTAHLAESGELREDHLARIVRWHLDDLCSLTAELGVPREKLFTHVGGWKEEELLYDAAVNEYSCPGWSFYRHARDPGKDKGVEKALRKSDAPYWAAVEWLLTGKNSEEAWYDALKRTLSIPKCRYVCIYNWNSIMNDGAAIDAIKKLLGRHVPNKEHPGEGSETN